VVALETRARREGAGWVIDGDKRWIGNGTFADLLVVCARDDDGDVGAFVVEKGTPGLEAQVITGKTSKRSVLQADVRLRSVRVPADHRLAGANSFADTAAALRSARLAAGWEALGHAIAVYEVASQYVQQRVQFGQPLAAFQIIQQRLAWMLTEITAMHTLAVRAAQLMERGELSEARSAVVKMYNSARARAIVAEARDMLGGNGILLDFHVARHQTDMEAVLTYEGTDTIQALIIGREITGMQAFAPRRRA
jgi:glutaryl-CoA dehydrogenase